MRILFTFILQLFTVSVFAAVWTVDLATDNALPNGASSGPSSGDLRYCVNTASPGDYIIFNIPLTSPPYVITLTNDLVITKQLSIDGSTQPDYVAGSAPVISISGSTSGYGIIFAGGADYSSIGYIHFNNQGGTAITVNGAGYIYIDGCYVGTDFTGNNYSPTAPPDTGIYVANTTSQIIIGSNNQNVILSPSGIVSNNSSYVTVWYNMIGLNRQGLNPGGIKRTILKGIESINSHTEIRNVNIGNCSVAAITADVASYYLLVNASNIGRDLNSGPAPNGRGIWANGTNNNISSNVIANSSVISGSSGAALEIGSGAANNNINSNSYSCNEGGGIVFNGSSGLPSPTFTAASFGVYPDGSANISGSGVPAFATVECFLVDTLCTSFPTEGIFINSTTADFSGNWSVNGSGFKAGKKVTAVLTDGSNVSVFAAPVNLVPFNCATITTNAGTNSTSCGGSFYLNGSVTNASGGTWSTSGKGYFSPSNTDLTSSASYVIDNEDIKAGSVIITLSNSDGGCPTVSSSFVLSLPIPKADIFAGVSSVSACPNTSGIPLDLKVYNPTSGGTWTTSGNGSFSPNATSTNATYIPDQSTDLAGVPLGGSITLTFTPNAGTCPAMVGSVSMDFNNFDPINIPETVISTCSDYPVIGLQSNSSRLSIFESWTYNTSGGPSIKDSLWGTQRYFVPTAADLNAGTVTLIDKVSVPGCVPDYDTLKITYVTPPVVFAGDSSAICGSATSFSLTGAAVSNLKAGGTIQWSGYVIGSGPLLAKQKKTLGLVKEDGGQGPPITGIFQNDTAVKTVYLPSEFDRIQDGVVLVLTATTAGNECSVSNSFPLTFEPVPAIDSAGTDITLCQGDTVKLNGMASPGFPHKWITPVGKGTFFPSDTSLVASYVPAISDYKKVAFTLILTAGNPKCIVRNDLLLILLPKPDVGVGSTQSICESSAELNAAPPGLDQVGLWTIAKGSSGEITDSTNNNTQVINLSESVDVNTYIWTITDNITHCSNSAKYLISHCFAPPLTVYNALSPNQDGVGDFLRIDSIGFYPDNKVSIFNQWGEMVFKKDKYDNMNDVFVGRSNVGTVMDLPNGSYYYLIDKGEDKKGKKINPDKGFLVIQK